MIYHRAKPIHNFLNCLKLRSTVAQHCSIANSNNFNFGQGDFTISFWMYRSVVNAAKDLLIYSKVAGNGVGLRIQFRFNGEVRVSGGMPGGWPWAMFTAAGVGNTAGQWIHWAVLRDGGSNAGNLTQPAYKIYKNGLQVGTAYSNINNGATSSNLDNTTTATIGEISSANDGNTYYLDEFSFFAAGLTASEIAGLYNSGLGAVPPSSRFASVRGYWRMDEKNGRTLVDSSNLYNTSLTTVQNGSLINYSDAEVAANGQPQSNQTAWCDHTSLNPIITI